jgi:hypothetical protein
VKKYASFIINPLGFSMGGRNVSEFGVSIVMLAIFVAFLSLLRPILDPTPTSPVFSFLS